MQIPSVLFATEELHLVIATDGRNSHILADLAATVYFWLMGILLPQ